MAAVVEVLSDEFVLEIPAPTTGMETETEKSGNRNENNHATATENKKYDGRVNEEGREKARERQCDGEQTERKEDGRGGSNDDRPQRKRE